MRGSRRQDPIFLGVEELKQSHKCHTAIFLHVTFHAIFLEETLSFEDNRDSEAQETQAVRYSYILSY